MVRSERARAQGHVVSRMFRRVEADITCWSIGDDEDYGRRQRPRRIDALLSDHSDMVVGFEGRSGRGRLRPAISHRNWMRTSFCLSVFVRPFKDIFRVPRVSHGAS